MTFLECTRSFRLFQAPQHNNKKLKVIRRQYIFDMNDKANNIPVECLIYDGLPSQHLPYSNGFTALVEHMVIGFLSMTIMQAGYVDLHCSRG